MATIDLGKIQPLWRGEFSPTPATNYEPLDNLSYLDTVYICILEADGTQLPTNTTYFKPLIDLTTYKLQSIIAFVVSQYAGGDATIVAPISAGLPIAAYDWFIDTNTLQVFAKNGSTGTFSDPLDFDPATGVDSGVTGTLLNRSTGDEIDELSTANNARTKAALNAVGSAPIYAVRAWVNFNNSGVIGASGNVISVTTGAIGEFTATYDVLLPTAGAPNGIAKRSLANVAFAQLGAIPTTSSCRVHFKEESTGSGVSIDFGSITVVA
jgi:hypothetical protein